jgi:Na+/H+-dicarboxylate symporter
MNILKRYIRIPLITRIMAGFLAGSLIGGLLWYLSLRYGISTQVAQAMRYCSPFGSVFVSMLKMIVVPVIFISLVIASASLPLEKLGRIGGKVIAWYFATMTAALRWAS